MKHQILLLAGFGSLIPSALYVHSFSTAPTTCRQSILTLPHTHSLASKSVKRKLTKYTNMNSSFDSIQTSLRLAASDSSALPEKKGFFGRIKASMPSAQERKKLLPLALMFFCILFSYTILRDTKDVLMVTAPKSGAEVIPFVKTYVNLPTAIAFTGLYAKMTDSMELKNVFYACVVPFLIFFGSFAWLIYPNRGILHPHALVDVLANALPANFAAPLAMVRNWSFVLFYVMAEMWGSVVTSLLFWGFANEVTTVEEAKKYCTFEEKPKIDKKKKKSFFCKRLWPL